MPFDTMPDRQYYIALDEAAQAIIAGKVLLFPTDTIWGLGGAIDDPAVADTIYDLKNRPKEKSFILLVSDYDQLGKYVLNLPAESDLEFLWEQPTTVIFPGSRVPDHLQNPAATGAFRIVKEGFCHDLIRLCNMPLISTSPNFSGEKTPLVFGEISTLITQDPRVTPVPDWIERYQPMTHRASRILKWNEDGLMETIRP